MEVGEDELVILVGGGGGTLDGDGRFLGASGEGDGVVAYVEGGERAAGSAGCRG